MKTEQGPAELTCSVAEVDKVLLSVANIVDKGNMVQFGPTAEHCFIQNIKIGKRMSLDRRRDVYVMDLEVIPPTAVPSRMKTLAAVSAWEQKASPSGGSRQAARP